jgi:hypothetical protein
VSQRLVTTDDHTGAEILSGITESGTSVSISRNGQTVTWEGVNLTDESWGQLTALLNEYLPGITPSGQEPITPEPTPEPQAPTAEAELAATKARAERLITEAATQREDTTAARQAQTAQRHGGRANGKPATQAEARAHSKAARAWWYGLGQGDLNKLGLPTPRNRQSFIGKLPQAVTDVYSQLQTA